jgi:hypothetical protein
MSILCTLERFLFVLDSFHFATTGKDTGCERLPGGLGSLVMAQFDTGLIAGIREAARQVKGVSRRNLFAWACRTYAGGSPRAAETIFGWNRKAVARGLSESEVTLPENVAPFVEKKRC